MVCFGLQKGEVRNILNISFCRIVFVSVVRVSVSVLATCCESLFNVKKENETEARAAVDFWQNSWSSEESESEGEASENSIEVLQKTIKHF